MGHLLDGAFGRSGNAGFGSDPSFLSSSMPGQGHAGRGRVHPQRQRGDATLCGLLQGVSIMMMAILVVGSLIVTTKLIALISYIYSYISTIKQLLPLLLLLLEMLTRCTMLILSTPCYGQRFLNTAIGSDTAMITIILV